MSLCFHQLRNFNIISKNQKKIEGINSIGKQEVNYHLEDIEIYFFFEEEQCFIHNYLLLISSYNITTAMGCVNDKAQSATLPPAIQKPPTQNQPDPIPQQPIPRSVAFQIPNDDFKAKKAKPNRFNKQLYIIRQVSNLNHELVESPLKKQELPIEPPVITEDYKTVLVKQRRKTQTERQMEEKGKQIDSSRSDAKTAHVILDETPIIKGNAVNRYRRRDLNKKEGPMKNRVDNSALSDRSAEQLSVDEAKKKKRKGSHDQYSLGSQSVHFKRAKTLHNQNEPMRISNSISMEKPLFEPFAEQHNNRASLSPQRDYNQQLKQIIQSEGEQSENLIELYYFNASKQQRKGEYQNAISLNSKYLKLCRKKYGMDSCSYASGLAQLSSIHYSSANYEKAIENMMKAKSIKSFSNLQGDMHKGRVLNEIGLIELEQNHLKEATHYFEQVHEIHSRVIRQLNANIQDLQPQISQVSSHGKYFLKSVVSMQLALNICIRAFGQNSLQTANHLDDLGTGFCDAHRFKQCLQSYQRCFDIMKRIKLIKHKDYETHIKNFNFNLQIIKLYPNCELQTIKYAILLLENHFPDNQIIKELKSRARQMEVTPSPD